MCLDRDSQPHVGHSAVGAPTINPWSLLVPTHTYLCSWRGNEGNLRQGVMYNYYVPIYWAMFLEAPLLYIILLLLSCLYFSYAHVYYSLLYWLDEGGQAVWYVIRSVSKQGNCGRPRMPASRTLSQHQPCGHKCCTCRSFEKAKLSSFAPVFPFMEYIDSVDLYRLGIFIHDLGCY